MLLQLAGVPASSLSPIRDLEAFLVLISKLSGRLAGAPSSAVDSEVKTGLGELLTFFGVEQCGILQIQSDRRQARLTHLAYAEGVTPLPTTIDFGSYFPWTHERSVMQGRMFFQTRRQDLPSEATVDYASAAAFGLETIINIPIGIGGRITHVLGLVSGRPMKKWRKPILSRLQIIAETFLSALLREQAELALASSERSLAQAQRVAQVGSYELDWTTGALTGSDEAKRIFGRDLLEPTGDVLEFLHPEDRTSLNENLERIVQSRMPWADLEYRIVRADGTIRTIRSRMETTYRPDGAPQRTLGTIQDISELRAAEQESRELQVKLRHADRAAHIGTLTASLSHELSQPLTGILANSQAALRLLAHDQVDAPELREILDAIVRDDKRAAAVIANLRLLLRREEPAPAKFDMAEAIAELMTLFRNELEACHVRVELHLEADCHAVAVRTQIQQVVLNLLSNAVRALQAVPTGNRHLRVSLTRTAIERIKLVVQDNGVGISAERLPHIFEPFFTTHQDGLGMGLAIARSIVESNGGALSAHARDEGGATFQFTLPVEPPASPGNLQHQAQEPTPDRHCVASDGRSTVCVVDDDRATREGVARLLQATGLRVVTFESAASVLASPELFAAQCLVLDVQMPDMSGPALQAELARRAATIPVVFLSAGETAATVVEVLKQGAVDYLSKPVDATVLVDAVSNAITLHAEQHGSIRARAEIKERIGKLTNRERDVLCEVLTGQLNKQIAAKLAISEPTVKQHRGQVMDKLAVSSVAELIRLCQIGRFPS